MFYKLKNERPTWRYLLSAERQKIHYFQTIISFNMSEMEVFMKLELLTNELFIECFEYLNSSDIFYSFDQLNVRFHTLIRNIPLHLNFQNTRKSLFNQFFQTVLLNSDMKNFFHFFHSSIFFIFDY
jgi:hypothetical protein